MEETGNVKALEKALCVLDAVRDADSPLGVNEIAKICGMSAATVYRMLRTMRSHGWVYQDENEKYTVGYKISLATCGTSFRLAMRETAYHVMARLSESEHEAMNLVVRDPDKCYILGQSRTTKIVDYVPPVGTVLPLHASACGKILLSEIKEPMLGEILDSIDYKRMTASTICSKEEFMKELAAVRERGFALDAHESQEEGFCIAVPVRAAKGAARGGGCGAGEGEIIAALSFSGFIGQKTVGEIDHYVKLLHGASAEITARLFDTGNGTEE